MKHVQTTGGVERYDDLHIDLIDAKWKTPTMWISGGLSALTLASSVQAFMGHGLVVVLGISLCAEDIDYPVPSTAKDLLEQLDKWTPPSLYLFRSGEEPWHDSRCRRHFIETNFGHVDQDIKGIYLEFRRQDGEQGRSFFMIQAADLHREI
jgi:hypothetical protein